MSTAASGLNQPGGPLFGRFAQLVVSNSSQGVDLSQLRFRFEVRANDADTPNVLTVRIYNLKESTVKKIIAEFDTVTLTAGYENGAKGTIFTGTVKQFKFGRERNVDSYLEILAADGDLAHQSTVNIARPAGTTDSQSLSDLAAAMGIPVAQTADGFLSASGIVPSPRGKTYFGMTRAYTANLAEKNGTRYSIQNGVLTLVPNTGYLQGEIVVLNSLSGMIGQPESTDNGIMVRCLLNPLIHVGRAVQIDNASITQFGFPAANSGIGHPGAGGAFLSQFYPASTAADGLYRVLVVEHVGDTRSNDFYTELTCLVIDRSSPTNQSVLPQG